MIEPDKNGHRSGSVARGVARQVASGKTGVRLTWILSAQTGVRQARRRRVRDPLAPTANAVAEHARARFGEPVQHASRSAVSGGMEASDGGPSMYPRGRNGE